VQLGRTRVRNRRADELVNARLDREQEVPGRGRNREEGRVEAREGRRAREDAEVVDDLIELAAARLGSPSDQAEQPLVRVGLAEQVDRLVGEDLPSEIAAMLLGQVVAKAGEDDPVQGLILRRLERPCTATDELFMRPGHVRKCSPLADRCSRPL
jgi:hypothetical protein